MIIDKDFLTLEQKIWIEETLLVSDDICWNIQSYAAKNGDGGFHFAHQALTRTGKKTSLLPAMVGILNSFCAKNGILYKNIYRCSVNITFNTGNVYRCPTHVDHDNVEDYKQLIIYLNESSGDTVVYENDEAVIVNPEKYKGVYFGDHEHYHYYPINGIRAVAVFTFDGDVIHD